MNGLVEWRVTSKDGKSFSFVRSSKGETLHDEAYICDSPERAAIYAVSIIHGFQPPRGLIRSDRQFDKTQFDTGFQPFASPGKSASRKTIFQRFLEVLQGGRAIHQR